MKPFPQTVWLTGASSGIGAALAKVLLEKGCRVIVTARRAEPLQQLANAFPGQCLALAMDLTDPLARVSAGHKLRQWTSHLDAVILNAGTCEYVDVQNFSADTLMRVMDVNYAGAANTLELALPLLRTAPEPAQILGISSMATWLPLPRSEAYGASKAALEFLLESLRVDLAAENIHVGIVRPGFVKTPLTDRNDFAMPFLQMPELAVAHILKALAQRRLLIQFPWQLVALMRFTACLPTSWKVAVLKKMARNPGAENANQ